MRKSLVLAFERQPPAVTVSAERKRRQRSKNLLLPGIDGRSAWAQRCKTLIAEHVADLGGIEHTTAAQRSLVRRAGVLATELEIFERRLSLGDKSGLSRQQRDELVDMYARAANQLRRLLQAIGLTRRATPKKKMSGALAEILREDERVRALRAQLYREEATDAEIVEDGDGR